MSAFRAILARDLRLALRQALDSLLVVAFFVIAVVLFPLGVGPEANVLSRMSSGVIWVAALLSVLLSMDRLFQADYEDGSLDLLALSPAALETVVIAKVLAHWLVTGLPLIIAAPVLAVLLNMPADGFGLLVLALLLGTPALNLIGALGAALVLGARRGGVLLALLILPLSVPVLIFGVGAVEAAISGYAARVPMLLLGAILAGSLALCPWGAAAALRQALE
ncbi:MAG: heme exporter protein CcmB [Rhodospirillaceae bacterium]